LLTSFIVGKIYGEDVPFESNRVMTVVLMCGLPYSALFLWLGRRKFERMELRDVLPGEGMKILGTEPASARWLSWLVCKPQGYSQNLLRKEARLQKPVWLSAAIFSVLWLVGLGMDRMWPGHGYNHFLEVLLCFYVPLALILAGCISLTDEKALGVATWQLTLPVASWRLWLAKLGVATISGIAAGVVLPCLMGILAAATDSARQGLSWPDANEASILLFISWTMILVSFWASTLVVNVVRAALVTLAVFAIGGGWIVVGIWGSLALSYGQTCVQSKLFNWIMVRYQLSPDDMVNGSNKYLVVGLWIGAALLAVMLLGQSLAQFRRTLARRETIMKYSLMLSLLVAGFTYWCGDCISSAQSSYNSPWFQELSRGLRQVSANMDASSDTGPQEVTIADTDKYARLSDTTKTWLRGATITVQRVGLSGKRYAYQATVRFPNGHGFSFDTQWEPTPR
jgi:hypothetical protein